MADGNAFGRPEPPRNAEAEQALLGSLMQSGRRALERIGPILRAEHFSYQAHASIFEAVQSTIARGADPDLISVGAALRDDPQVVAIGGQKYLAQVYRAAQTVGPSPSLKLWAEDVVGCWRRRREIELGTELAAAPDRETAAAIRRDLIALDADSIDKPSFPITIASELAGQPVPDRAWLVPGLIPMRQCTILSGPGGTGKSLLALQLQAACAVGGPWLGLPVERVRSLAIYSEDGEDELHLRAAAVAASMGADLSEFADMAWRSAILDPHEMVEDDGRGGLRQTAYYDWAVAAAKAFKARLLILDSSANVFGGNEIVRRQVRQFSTALNRLAVEIDGAVILLSHPSAAGMGARTGNSGSTAWVNSTRSMLYLERDPDPDADPDTRILSATKSNYGRVGVAMRIQWRDGVFHALDEPGSLDRTAMASKAERVFLALLASTYANSDWVSPRRTANNFAATVFARHPAREGVNRTAFENALHRLQQRDAVVTEEYGPPSRRAARLRPS